MRYKTMPGKEIKTLGKITKEMDATITIVTPFYNGEKTLMETANSIFSQTYPFFEWIIVNDGSTSKNSKKALDDLEKMDKRVKVFHKENGGPSVARDYGIEKADSKTKYIYFIDCDDIIENNMLEMMYWALETHQEASFVYPSIMSFGDSKGYWEPYFTLEEVLAENIMCINTMVKKSDLLEVGCFGIKEKAMYEDWNLWLKLLAAEKVPVRINPLSFWYRANSTGEFSRSKKNHKAQALINQTIKNVKKDVDVIQYPRMSKHDIADISGMTLPSYENDNSILFIIKDTGVNRENILVYENLKRLSKLGYRLSVVSTQPLLPCMRQDIQEYSHEFYDLSNFIDFKDYPLFINYLIQSRNIDNVLISDNTFGYAFVPTIREHNNKVKVHVLLEEENQSLERILGLVDSVITTNNDLYLGLKDHYEDVRLIEVDENDKKTLSYDKDKLREKYGIPRERIVLSFVDNVSVENKPQIFLEIARKLLAKNNQFFFVITGEGTLECEVKEYIENNNLSESILLLNEQRDSSEIIQASDVIINTSSDKGLSLSNYLAISNGVPLVGVRIKNEDKYLDQNCSLLVVYVETFNSSGYEAYADVFINEINRILDSLNDYQSAAKTYAYRNAKLYDLYADVTCKLLSKKGKENVSVVYSNEIYSYYVNGLETEFRNRYLSYYKELHDIVPRESIDRSRFAIMKRKLRGFGLRHNIAAEMHYIFLKLVYIASALKYLFLFIKNVLLAVIYIIPITFMLIKLLFKLICSYFSK